MPSKQTKNAKVEVKHEAQAPVEEVKAVKVEVKHEAQAPVDEVKAKKAPAKGKGKSEEAPIAEASAEEAPIAEASSEEAPSEKKNAYAQIAELIQETEDILLKECDHLKNYDPKSSTLKNLKGAAKSIKQLKALYLRVAKKKIASTAVIAKGDVGQKQTAFSMPVQISSELRKFLKLGSDDQVSRTDVSTALWNYVKDKGLKNPSDGRRFIPDDALAKLFGTRDESTFFNIQVLLKPHYISAPESN